MYVLAQGSYVPLNEKVLPRAKRGAYGEYGTEALVLVVTPFDPSLQPKEAIMEFVHSMEDIVEAAGPSYNPLEHPLNKDTFERSFAEADRVLSVRNKLDPQGLFVDPSKVDPTNL